MCGICGIIDWSGRSTKRAERELWTRRMLARLSHRGPDDHDVYSDDLASIGAARLSIVDLSKAGRQPMKSPTGRYIQAFNGEIYNYRELRKALADRGEAFVSDGDSEVLLRLYERKGEACLQDLRGMFAFAIWDTQSRSLFLARDRVGEKPLVYSYSEGCFAFASEINALLALPWVSREPDWEGIHYGLHYVHIPAPQTAFKQISRLPAATALKVDGGGLTFRRYWKLRFEERYGPEDREKCCRDLVEVFDEATALCSRSDVPVGTFLSGGLDSSLVTASLAKNLSGFPTFRISHDGPEDDEEKAAAQAVASRYQTRHASLILGPDILESLRDFVAMHAEPTGTMVALNYYRLANVASRQVAVVLSGSGGDELFGGYDLNYMENLDRSRVHWKALRGLLEDGQTQAAASGDLKEFARQMRDIDATGPERVYAKRHLAWGRKFVSAVYSPRMKELAAAHPPENLLLKCYSDAGTDRIFNATVYQMLNLTCSYSLVDHADICGMASALEVRSPFLDVRLMELAAAIPPAWKVGEPGHQRYGKVILTEAMGKRLPDEVLNAAKIGFGGGVPYNRWLSDQWDQCYHREALEACGLFDLDEVERLAKQDLPRMPQLAHLLFHVLTIGVWHSLYAQ